MIFNKVKILIFSLIVLMLIIIFKNNQILSESIIEGSLIFFKNVFPYMFVMMVINNILIETNIINFFYNPYDYIFIMSFLGGSPFNAIIINSLLDRKIIDTYGASRILAVTFFYNPLFLYSMLNALVGSHKIYFLFYLYGFNIIYFIMIRKKLYFNNINKSNLNSISLNNAFSKTIINILTIYSIMIFCKLVSDIFIQNSFILTPILKGLIEITQGLYSLSNYSIITIIKELEINLILSFGGLSILLQIFNILPSQIDYSYFFINKINLTLIGCLIIILCNFCL